MSGLYPERRNICFSGNLSQTESADIQVVKRVTHEKYGLRQFEILLKKIAHGDSATAAVM